MNEKSFMKNDFNSIVNFYVSHSTLVLNELFYFNEMVILLQKMNGFTKLYNNLILKLSYRESLVQL